MIIPNRWENKKMFQTTNQIITLHLGRQFVNRSNARPGIALFPLGVSSIEGIHKLSFGWETLSSSKQLPSQ